MPPLRRRRVNMRRVHPPHAPDARQQLVGRQIGRQPDQKQTAVGLDGDRGRLVARHVRVAAVVGREAFEQQRVRLVLRRRVGRAAAVHRVVKGRASAAAGEEAAARDVGESVGRGAWRG